MLIKRYPNRKLYNTATRRYIALADIAVYVREGETVQVIDHATGEDMTAATLAQVIGEQEKRRRGLFPGQILSTLFQAGEETAGRLRLLLDWSASVDEEIRRRVAILVDQEQFTADEGERLLAKLLMASGGPALPGLNVLVERLVAERNLPSRKEILALNEQLDDLLRRFDAHSRKDG
ncbi:MAG: polyhydroxyalkanoate synthesis regulator DNA-binding domain-containing protein [Chloroflexota bacterium]